MDCLDEDLSTAQLTRGREMEGSREASARVGKRAIFAAVTWLHSSIKTQSRIQVREEQGFTVAGSRTVRQSMVHNKKNASGRVS